MEIPALLRRLEGKIVSERELSHYFRTDSLEELLLALRRLRREGCLKFEVMLSAEYISWGRARTDVLVRADVLNHYDPFGALNGDAYGLSVKAEKSLSESEIIEVIRKLPGDIAVRYLHFKLNDIDQEELLEYFMAQHQTHGAAEDEFYDRVEWGGLAVDGVEVTYINEPVCGLGFQHRQALRLLIKKKGKLCFKDEFTDAEAGIYKKPPTDHALRNLIHEVRKALRTVTGADCIRSTPGEGWSLRIEP